MCNVTAFYRSPLTPQLSLDVPGEVGFLSDKSVTIGAAIKETLYATLHEQSLCVKTHTRYNTLFVELLNENHTC